MGVTVDDTEASWTKYFTSENVCFYFYIMFFLAASFAAIAVGMDLLLMLKKPKLGLFLLVRSLPAVTIALLNSLFLYIVCARSLLK